MATGARGRRKHARRYPLQASIVERLQPPYGLDAELENLLLGDGPLHDNCKCTSRATARVILKPYAHLPATTSRWN
jgi:hypothetical protein